MTTALINNVSNSDNSYSLTLGSVSTEVDTKQLEQFLEGVQSPYNKSIINGQTVLSLNALSHSQAVYAIKRARAFRLYPVSFTGEIRPLEQNLKILFQHNQSKP